MKKYLKIFLVLFSCLFASTCMVTSCTADNKTTVVDNVTVDTTTNNVETYKKMIYQYVYNNLSNYYDSCIVYDVEILGYDRMYVYCKYTVVVGRKSGSTFIDAETPKTLYIKIRIKEGE